MHVALIARGDKVAYSIVHHLGTVLGPRDTDREENDAVRSAALSTVYGQQSAASH